MLIPPVTYVQGCQVVRGSAATGCMWQVKAFRTFKHDLQLSSMVQYERWNFPLLGPSPVSNVAASLQLMYWPGHAAKAGNNGLK